MPHPLTANPRWWEAITPKLESVDNNPENWTENDTHTENDKISFGSFSSKLQTKENFIYKCYRMSSPPPPIFHLCISSFARIIFRWNGSFTFSVSGKNGDYLNYRWIFHENDVFNSSCLLSQLQVFTDLKLFRLQGRIENFNFSFL